MRSKYISVEVEANIDLSDYEDEIIKSLSDEDIVEQVEKRGIRKVYFVEYPSIIGEPKYKVHDILADLAELPHTSSTNQILEALRELME